MSNRHSRTLLELVQAAQDPFTSATERKSDTVIEMISKLKEDFTQELQDKNKAELEAVHQFEMKKQESEQNAAAAKKKETESREAKAEAQANEGTAQKNLDVESKSLKDDKKYLAEITADCTQKAKDFKVGIFMYEEQYTGVVFSHNILLSAQDVNHDPSLSYLQHSLPRSCHCHKLIDPSRRGSSTISTHSLAG